MNGTQPKPTTLEEQRTDRYRAMSRPQLQTSADLLVTELSQDPPRPETLEARLEAISSVLPGDETARDLLD